MHIGYPETHSCPSSGNADLGNNLPLSNDLQH